MTAIDSEVVLLESPAVLAQLLLAWPALGFRKGRPQALQTPADAPRAANPRHAESPALQEPERVRPYRSRVCSCGVCVRCRDNAKWNRIFDEKFADPSYYAGISVRHNSSLSHI
jgi:hypothetical protein